MKLFNNSDVYPFIRLLKCPLNNLFFLLTEITDGKNYEDARLKRLTSYLQILQNDSEDIYWALIPALVLY